jgi:hypothetical protein
MARPAIYDQPMTAAERMRRYRERKRNPPATPSPRSVKQAAAIAGLGLRYAYYYKAYQRNRLFDWDEDVENKLSTSFLGIVCTQGDEKMQRAVHDWVKKYGVKVARAMWNDLPPGISTRRQLIATEKRVLKHMGSVAMPTSTRAQLEKMRDDLLQRVRPAAPDAR